MTQLSKVSVLVSALVMTCAASAQAGGRSRFTPPIFAKVQSAKDGLEKLRVYLNRELLVVRNGLIEKNTDVHGDVKTVIREKELTEVLSPRASGKIVALEGTEANTQLVLYVSFDPACSTKECAYQFVEQGSNHCPYYSRNCYFNANNEKPFVLSQVAPNANYTDVKLYAKTVFIFTTSARTNDFTLRVRDADLIEVLRESRRIPGWDGRSGD